MDGSARRRNTDEYRVFCRPSPNGIGSIQILGDYEQLGVLQAGRDPVVHAAPSTGSYEGIQNRGNHQEDRFS
jgi:hypothetical protein